MVQQVEVFGAELQVSPLLVDCELARNARVPIDIALPHERALLHGSVGAGNHRTGISWIRKATRIEIRFAFRGSTASRAAIGSPRLYGAITRLVRFGDVA